MDGDYRAPRNSKAKTSQLSSKSSPATRLSRRRLDPASNTSPQTANVKFSATTRPTDGRSTGSSSNPPVIVTNFGVLPALAQTAPARGVVFPSSTSITPSTSNPTGEPERPVLPIPDQVTSSFSSITSLAIASPESPDSTTVTVTQSKMALSPGAETLSTSDNQERASTPSSSQLVSTRHDAPFPLPAPPSPQDGAPTFGNSSNSNSQDSPPAPAPNHSPSRGTVADQLAQPQNGSETNVEEVVEKAAVVRENISNLLPAAEVELNGGASFATDVIGPDKSVSAGAEPSTSAIGTETPPLSEGVQPGNFAFTSSASEQDDQMVVDEPVPTSDDIEDPHGMLASLPSDSRQIKIRCAMLLLRDLLQDKQIQSDSIHPTALPSDARYTLEESFTMEERLKLVEECSSLLSKYVSVYEGRELEERMTELDEQLQVQQELSTTESDVRARSHSPVRVDKGVSTVDPSELLNQGQGIIGDKQVEKLTGTLQDPATNTVTRQSLTPEATMVDLSSVPLTTPSTGSDLALVSDLFHEFKSMKEEMRKGQQRIKEDIESIAQLHREELISLKEQMRATEDKYWVETESLQQRHREEMDSLMRSVRGEKKQGERATVEAEGKLPLFEVLELRVTALESHTRSLTHSPTQAGQYSRPVCEDESNITASRRPPFHPLGHLFDYKDAVSPVSYGSATPIQSEPSNAGFINSVPLPIKSKRKFQSMYHMSLT